MRFSAKGRYGVRAMIDLAIHDQGAPVSARGIAERQDISPDYLEQILRRLRERGLVESTRGPKGGFRLTRPCSEISLWEVFEALEEPVSPAPCVNTCGNDGPCEREPYCAARLFWERVGSEICRLLRSSSLGDVIEDSDASDAKLGHGLRHMFYI